MMELDELRRTAHEFVDLTDHMLVAAQSGLWDEFLDVHAAREQQMGILELEAGDSLLRKLPELRPDFERALETSLHIDELARARRDDLGENLASFQAQRRLHSAYR
jgi:hypothetical protein